MHVPQVALNRMRRLLKLGLSGFAAIALAYAGLLLWIWSDRTEIEFQSGYLKEKRSVTVFGSNSEVTVYSLDGDKLRHGLLPATNGALIAWASGKQQPMLVAVRDHGGRDRDLRPEKVRPAS